MKSRSRRYSRAPVRWSVPPILAMAAVLLIAPCAHSQRSGIRSGPGPTTPPVGMDMAGYTLSPGDVVTVSVYREDDLSGSYKIGPMGTISMHFADRVQAAGLTTDQLRDAIVDALRAVIKRPVVQVQIDVENSARQPYVGGEVAQPGRIAVPFGATVAEAVISAGVTPSSDLSAVRLSRAGEATITVDLSGLRGEGDIDRGQVVRDGDVIYVSRYRAEFSVLGMVSQPGPYPIPADAADQMTVVRALNAAGGHAPGADLSLALLVRSDGSSEKIDLRALLFDGDMAQNKPIRTDDVLVVRQAGNVTVAGELNEPGSFQVPQPIGVLEAVARAAGFTPNADLKNASILGEEGATTVDLEGLWWRGDVTQNVQISPGETLIVPERDPEEVLIVGAVENAGAVDVHRARDRTVLRLVQVAKPTPLADLTRITVHRLGAETPLTADVHSAMKQGNMESNIGLQAGDIVFVPELRKVYAIGAFVQAGVYPLTEGMTLTELVAQAGSFRPDALPAKMRLVRPAPDGTKVTPIDFNRMTAGRDTDTYLLQEGDVVFLPLKGRGGLSWASIRDAIWATVGLIRVF